MTPLNAAAYDGRTETAAALIAAKADLEAKDNVRGADGGSGCGGRGQERWRGVRVGSMPGGEMQRRLRARMMWTGRIEGERRGEKDSDKDRNF